MTDKTDAEIVEETLIDKATFAELVLRYEHKLPKYMQRLGVYDEEDRIDLLQDVFIKVYKNLAGYDPKLSFSSWIYRITHNECVSFFRKKGARPQIVTTTEEGSDLLEFIQDEGEPLQQVFDKESKTIVEEGLSTLSELHRDILVLRFFEEYDYKEISDILKIPMGSVATHIHRAKKALRDNLKHHHG